MHLPLRGVSDLLRQVRAWPQSSQEHARRNAMIAATACAQRRIEREEVEDYLASMTTPPGQDVTHRWLVHGPR